MTLVDTFAITLMFVLLSLLVILMGAFCMLRIRDAKDEILAAIREREK